LNLDALVTEVILPTLEGEKIPWHGWHAFRRELASNLHRLGVSDKVIQQILRHANVTTTINIYVKIVTQDAEDAMKKLETKCSLVVPQLPLEGIQLGTKNEVITVQQVLPLEAVRGNLAERGDSSERLKTNRLRVLTPIFPSKMGLFSTQNVTENVTSRAKP